MIDTDIKTPPNFRDIQLESERIKFSMPSDLQTGSLLRTLVTSKPHGSFLELGTGTGLSLSWIVEAMDKGSTVVSVDNDKDYLSIAETFFSNDERVSIICEDGSHWIKNNQDKKFDLIFADAWPGKYEALDETLSLLKIGGFYIIDDMLPQPNWPEGHSDNVDILIKHLETRKDIRLTKINWSTGLILIAKIN
ncbi:O-methyltransferase [Rubrolithibacter danxiaensis]|uniref:O-methyltransferase n=1 Tax=Rubrolithibacter danxiaensis TaxID=3390805 RepID=UPI003BF823CE